jgi:hypothetical protein
VAESERKVIEVTNKTLLGPKRLSIYLREYEGIEVPAGTIRHILRRGKHSLTHSGSQSRRRREKREFVDWYSAKPFEIVQVDLKYIRDRKAPTEQQIIHLDRCAIPNQEGDQDAPREKHPKKTESHSKRHL